MKAFRGISATRSTAFLCTVLLILLAACKPTTPRAEAGERSSGGSITSRSTTRRDLSADESRGGHTLKRHVGRTDEQLAARLREEPGISAASTYTDRPTAEAVIGQTLAANQSRISDWLQRNRHPNLVLDYNGQQSIGRTLNRGRSRPQPCPHAIVVLRWDGPDRYHVLTSYPECR